MRPEVAEVRPGEELDWVSLEAHLRRHLPQAQGEFSVLQFPNGSANLTYLVRFGETDLVVRRPPFSTIYDGSSETHRWAIAKRRLRESVVSAEKEKVSAGG